MLDIPQPLLHLGWGHMIVLRPVDASGKGVTCAEVWHFKMNDPPFPALSLQWCPQRMCVPDAQQKHGSSPDLEIILGEQPCRRLTQAPIHSE